MTRKLLSQQFVKTVSCPLDKSKLDFFDFGCRGLMLEVRPSGRKTYYLRYQDERRRTRQFKLAHAEDVSLAQARKMAQKVRNRIAMGGKPAEERAEHRQVATFARFVDELFLPYIKTYKRSWRTDLSFLNNHLLPKFGKKYLDEIDRKDVLALMQERCEAKAAPSSINRLLILLRFMFNLASKWQVPGVNRNPAAGVPLLEENNKRERFLTVSEANDLREAVSMSKNPMLSPIIAMLILTGARKREVLDAKWEDFDTQNRVWRIPISKSGRARHVPLSGGAIQVLESLRQTQRSAYPFGNPLTGKPYASIYVAWNTARTRAGLADVRMHDLRHSFASLLINNGRSLYEVQKILGHSQIQTTQRYAHLQQQTLLEAVELASAKIDHFQPQFIPENTKSASG